MAEGVMSVLVADDDGLADKLRDGGHEIGESDEFVNGRATPAVTHRIERETWSIE